MTLIEIMIVIGIFSLMMGMVIFGFSSSRSAETVRAVNQVSNAIRYGFDKARVGGSYYRLLVDLDKGTFTLQGADDRMYLPATDRDGKILEYDESKAKARADRDERAAENYNRSIQSQVLSRDTRRQRAIGGSAPGATAGAKPQAAAEFDPYAPTPRNVPRRKPPLFEGFTDENALSGLNAPIKLPDGVKITYVRTADDLDPILKGEASIYFFPRGQTQKAHILIKDEQTDLEWTIKVSPLTGRVTIEEGLEELDLPERRDDTIDELGKRGRERTF